MVERDQDDCTKRLICEVAHKQARGSRLSDVEQGWILSSNNTLPSLSIKTSAWNEGYPNVPKDFTRPFIMTYTYCVPI